MERRRLYAASFLATDPVMRAPSGFQERGAGPRPQRSPNAVLPLLRGEETAALDRPWLDAEPDSCSRILSWLLNNPALGFNTVPSSPPLVLDTTSR